MPKNAVKPETANETATSEPQGQNGLMDTTPYTEKTALGGPIFKAGYGVMPCRVQLSGKILAAAGLKPRDQVEITAESGQIILKKIGGPSPGLPTKSTKSGMDRALDALMTMTKEHEAKLRADRERLQAYREEAEAEDEEPDELSDEQRRQEEL